MLKLYSKKRKARNRALLHLSQTMRDEGATILMALLKQKSAAAKDIPQAIRSLAQEAQNRWKKTAKTIRRKGFKHFSQTTAQSALQIASSRLKGASRVPQTLQGEWNLWTVQFRELSSRREKAELAALMSLYALSFAGGLGLGYSLPQQNIKLIKKGQKQNFISLNAAPYFSVQLGIEYLKANIVRTQRRGSLNSEEKRTLAALERVLSHTLEGLAQGASVRRFQMGALSRRDKPSLPTLDIPLEAKAYAMMEQLFSVLMQQS